MITTDSLRAEPAAQAERVRDGGDDATLRRLARTNLLDLKTDFAFWNPDVPSPSPAPVELDELPSTTETTAESSRPDEEDAAR